MRIPPPVFQVAFATATLVVFTLAMIPLPDELTVFSFQDKVEHGLSFLVLMLMGHAAWPLHARRIAGGLVAYGLLIEICQHTLTTNRVGDPWDWLADSLGVLAACLILDARRRRQGT